MLRTLTVVAFLALVTASGALGTSRRPALRYDAGPPAVLQGSNFTPRSVVRVFMTGPEMSTFKVRVTLHGTFVLALPQTTSKCKAMIVQAIGVNGERASWGIGTTCSDAGIGDVTK